MGKVEAVGDGMSASESGGVEFREHAGLGHRRRQFGRTTAWVECPFCGEETEAYVWSLAGSGKRCRCSALLGPFGASREVTE